jgi:hypothetical protein
MSLIQSEKHLVHADLKDGWSVEDIAVRRGLEVESIRMEVRRLRKTNKILRVLTFGREPQ